MSLVLSRKHGEKIGIGNGITITVVAIRGGCVKLAIDAPPFTPVHRQEVLDAIAREQEAKAKEEEDDASDLRW